MILCACDMQRDDENKYYTSIDTESLESMIEDNTTTPESYVDTSCTNDNGQTNIPPEPEAYNIMLNIDSKGSILIIDRSKYKFCEDKNTEYINEVLVGTKKQWEYEGNIYTLVYENSLDDSWYSGRVINKYRDPKTEYTYGFDSVSGKICYIDAIQRYHYDTYFIDYPYELSNEDLYFSWLEPIVNQMFGINISEYDLFCQTLIGNQFENDFVIPSNASEKDNIYYYYLLYTRPYQGYQTPDVIKLILTSGGDVRFMFLYESGINRNTDLRIDEERLQKTVRTVAEDILKPSFTLSKAEITGTRLRITNEKLILTCGVKIVALDENNNEHETKIKMRIDLSS